MSDPLYRIDWKQLTDGIETNMPDQQAQDLLLFLEACVQRVEPCEHGNYDEHETWVTVTDRHGRKTAEIDWCEGARLGSNDEE